MAAITMVVTTMVICDYGGDDNVDVVMRMVIIMMVVTMRVTTMTAPMMVMMMVMMVVMMMISSVKVAHVLQTPYT